MPWFKVDDGWWSHPKTLQLSDAAQALWIRAGSWSMKHLTDGAIPGYALAVLRAKPKVCAELVAVGLWKRHRDGYLFHDWSKYQPTKDQVEAERAAAADRQRRARESRQKSRRDDDGTNGERSPSPTRPDPTRPAVGTSPEGGGTSQGPWCSRHPGGTEDPCGPCRTARMAFEAAQAEESKPKPGPVLGRIPKPGDGHPHEPDEHGFCPVCGERAEVVAS